MKPIILLLTCANDQEADQISKTLLEKNLIVCSKKSPVTSSFLWEGKLDSGNEVLLIMDSEETLFDKVEKEIKKIHSYDTFVLVALPVIKTTNDVEKWMTESLET